MGQSGPSARAKKRDDRKLMVQTKRKKQRKEGKGDDGGRCAHRQGDARRRARRVDAKEHDGAGRVRCRRHMHGDEGAAMGLGSMRVLVSRGSARGRRRHATRRRPHGKRLRHVAAFLLHFVAATSEPCRMATQCPSLSTAMCSEQFAHTGTPKRGARVDDDEEKKGREPRYEKKERGARSGRASTRRKTRRKKKRKRECFAPHPREPRRMAKKKDNKLGHGADEHCRHKRGRFLFLFRWFIGRAFFFL